MRRVGWLGLTLCLCGCVGVAGESGELESFEYLDGRDPHRPPVETVETPPQAPTAPPVEEPPSPQTPPAVPPPTTPATSERTNCDGLVVPTEWTWPVPQKQTFCQRFGNPIWYQECGVHSGLDICAPSGTPVVAVGAGKVVYVGPLWLNQPGAGRGPYAIVIQHGPNLVSTYSHNRRALVKAGDCVGMGEPIAEVGDLGFSYSPHLHVEFITAAYTGNWENPFPEACNIFHDPLGYFRQP